MPFAVLFIAKRVKGDIKAIKATKNNSLHSNLSNFVKVQPSIYLAQIQQREEMIFSLASMQI